MVTATVFAEDAKIPTQGSTATVGQVTITTNTANSAKETDAKQYKSVAAQQTPTGEADSNASAAIKEPEDFQKVVEEYKKYVSQVPAGIREEIIAYRKEIARINKEKRLLYKKLSQEAQDYLKTEQEYKKRLPLNRKSLINIDKQ